MTDVSTLSCYIINLFWRLSSNCNMIVTIQNPGVLLFVAVSDGSRCLAYWWHGHAVYLKNGHSTLSCFMRQRIKPLGSTCHSMATVMSFSRSHRPTSEPFPPEILSINPAMHLTCVTDRNWKARCVPARVSWLFPFIQACYIYWQHLCKTTQYDIFYNYVIKL